MASSRKIGRTRIGKTLTGYFSDWRLFPFGAFTVIIQHFFAVTIVNCAVALTL